MDKPARHLTRDGQKTSQRPDKPRAGHSQEKEPQTTVPRREGTKHGGMGHISLKQPINKARAEGTTGRRRLARATQHGRDHRERQRAGRRPPGKSRPAAGAEGHNTGGTNQAEARPAGHHGQGGAEAGERRDSRGEPRPKAKGPAERAGEHRAKERHQARGEGPTRPPGPSPATNRGRQGSRPRGPKRKR